MPVMTLLHASVSIGSNPNGNGVELLTMMEKETPKLWASPQSRFSSCL